MPWETRTRGTAYYTRTRREGGRVIREYVGTGERAREAAAEDEARRRQVEAERDAAQALAEDIQTLSELAELFARAALLAAGYHRSNRGPWRKRRVRNEATAATPCPDEQPRGATPSPGGIIAATTAGSGGVHG